MGVVYEAEDTRLRRHVALKLLPADLASDPEKVERFRREARVLASLNHPNIAQVHGVEEATGNMALVMELVEGPTLADRIAEGAIPLDEALAIARQIADALEVAHQQGIIHRDLKPANVIVRHDGTVKVLDFGLAKWMEPSGVRSPGPTESLTSPRPSPTQSGVILGTAAYMSPEQATGQPLDARSDVWAFGVVLYEMLTGRRAFEGSSVSETLATVLAGTPDWSRLPATVSGPVRALMRRCLARDARLRVKNMGAVRFVLDEGDALLGSGSSVSSIEPAVARLRSAALFTAAVVPVSVAMAAGFLWLSSRPVPSPILRTIIAADTITPNVDRNFAFTPDASRLAYVSSDSRQILVRPLDALDPLPILQTTSHLRGLFPSPDGRWLGYVENAFTLKKILVAGGPPAIVQQMDGPSRGASWGPDDTIVFATAATGTGLQQVAASGGPVTVLTRPDHERGEADHVLPVWLPERRGILFTILAENGSLDAAKVAVLDLTTGVWRAVVEQGYGARYTDGGYLVYGAAGALWATRFDLSRLEARGTPAQVLQHVSTSGFGVANFDIASNGTLVYPRDVPADSDGLVPVWVDRDGRETPLSAPAQGYVHPRLSPDGRFLAIVVEGDIFVWEWDRPWSTASRMTLSPFQDWFPVWTPGGRQIVFGSWRGGGFSNLYIQELDESVAKRLTESEEMQLPTSIDPDGSTVVFHSFAKRLEALRLEEPRHPVTLVETPLEERNGVVSPDGRWLAYEGESPARPGELDVYVRPFPEVDRTVWQATNGGATYPVWGPGGQELFYRKPDGTMVVLPVEEAGATWRAGSPQELFRGPYVQTDGTMGRHYDVDPDGRRFLMLKNVGHDAAGPPHFVIVQNWREELKRLVAANR